MRARTISRWAAASAVAGATAAVFLAPSAFASATTGPASALPVIYPSPLPSGALPSSGPGVKISGDCPAFLFTDPIGFEFISGNAVEYGPAPHFPGTQGGNAEGDATLVDGTAPTSYSGHTHLWFGMNTNPTGNGQNVFAETISFKGFTPDGHSISINANPGTTVSASGNVNGWGQLNLDCS